MHGLTRSRGFEVAFWLALAVSIFALGFVYNDELEMYRYGTTRWPQALAVLMVLAAIGQLYSGLRDREGKPEEKEADSAARGPGAGSLGHRLRVAATLALPVIYTLLLEYTGYYLTTPFFLAGYLYLAGEQRPKILVAVPAGTYLVITFLFTTLLYLGLPVGYWPGFYDVNNWIVGLFR